MDWPEPLFIQNCLKLTADSCLPQLIRKKNVSAFYLDLVLIFSYICVFTLLNIILEDLVENVSLNLVYISSNCYKYYSGRLK